MLNIINVPNPILRQASKQVMNVDKYIIQFIESLSKTLVKSDPPGVGLSAIQVAKPLRLFLTYLPTDKSLPMKKWHPKNMTVEVFINPKIVQTSTKTTLGSKKGKPSLEGCLSIPNIWGPVWRHQWVKVQYQTLDRQNNLQEVTNRFDDFAARVVQHEYDHLEGILFTDYIIDESPSPSFKSLGKIKPLFFNDGDQFVEIKDPTKLATW